MSHLPYVAAARRDDESFPRIPTATIEQAIESGLATGFSFDVHAESGAVVWLWEMRKEAA